MYGVVYKITNTINGKLYIGQTTKKRPRNRFMRHLRDARKNISRCRHLGNAIRKYGEANFTFEIIDSAESKEALDKLEQKYIVEYNTLEVGYNLMEGGSAGKHTEEYKQRMSKLRKEGKIKTKVNYQGVNPTPCFVNGFLYSNIGLAARCEEIPSTTLTYWLDGFANGHVDCEYLDLALKVQAEENKRNQKPHKRQGAAIIIDEFIYPSITHASKCLDIPYEKLRGRFRTKKRQQRYNYCYLVKDE